MGDGQSLYDVYRCKWESRNYRRRGWQNTQLVEQRSVFHDRKSFGKQSQDLINFLTPSAFTYEEVPELKAKVIGTFIDGNKVDEITENGEVIFDQTTFYAESGGQVADTGVITSDSAEANVLDVTKANHKQFLHHVELAYGSIKVGDEFTLKPDYARRHLIMRNHSATHILQKALQELSLIHI